MKIIRNWLLFSLVFVALAAASINEGFEGDTLAWSVSSTSGSAELALSGEEVFAGSQALKIQYENVAPGSYLRIVPAEPLAFAGFPLELDLRAWGGGEQIQLLLADALGKEFTFPLGTAYSQWLRLQLNWQTVQGAGNVQLPLTLTELRVFPASSQGKLYLDQLQSKALVLKLAKTAYQAEEPLKLNWQLESPVSFSLPLEVVLKRGESLVRQRQTTITAQNKTGSFDFSYQAPGQYECEFTIQIAEKIISFPLYKLAVLTQVPKSGGKPFLGVQTHYGLRRGRLPDNLDLAKLAGAELIRDEIFWGTIERTKGVFSFDEDYVGYVDEAVARGLIPLIILDYGNPLYEGGGAPDTPGKMEGWKRYVRNVVSQYKDRVKYWEVWNEFNIGMGFTEEQKQLYSTRSAKAELYFPLLKETYLTIKQIDPTAVVIGGVLAGVDLEFLQVLFAKGGLQYMDALSIHPYCYPQSPEAGNLLGRLDQVRNLMDQGGKRLPIWVTEIGWPTHQGDGRGVDEETQAAYLARMYTLFASQPDVAAVFWYDFQNDGTDPTYNEHNFGLIRQDFSLKPGYYSLSQIFRTLRGFTEVGAIKQGEGGLWHYRVASPQGEKHILWSTQGQQLVPSPVEGEILIRELDGSIYELTSPASLQVTGSPIIVEAKGTEWPDAEQGQLSFWFSANPLPKGEALGIYLEAAGELRTASVEVYNLAGRRLFQGEFLEPTSQGLTIPLGDAARGAYLVVVTGKFETGENLVERKLLLIL